MRGYCIGGAVVETQALDVWELENLQPLVETARSREADVGIRPLDFSVGEYDESAGSRGSSRLWRASNLVFDFVGVLKVAFRANASGWCPLARSQ